MSIIALPCLAGAQYLKQWELAVEEAAAELHSTEERLQAATQQLLALQADCAQAATEVQSRMSAAQKVRLIRICLYDPESYCTCRFEEGCTPVEALHPWRPSAG